MLLINILIEMGTFLNGLPPSVESQHLPPKKLFGRMISSSSFLSFSLFFSKIEVFPFRLLKLN